MKMGLAQTPFCGVCDARLSVRQVPSGDRRLHKTESAPATAFSQAHGKAAALEEQVRATSWLAFSVGPVYI